LGREHTSADEQLFWVQKLFEIVSEVKAELVKEYTEKLKINPMNDRRVGREKALEALQ